MQLRTRRHGLLDSLPNELLIDILRFIDCRGLIRCSLVCRRLSQLIRHSARLQLEIELAFDKVLDYIPSHPPAPSSERLHRLVERRQAWRNFHFKECGTIPSNGNSHIQYLVANGIFSSLMGPPQFNATVHLPHLTTQRFRAVRPAPCTSKIPSIDIDCTLDTPAVNFAMDPPQDLLLLVQPHPHGLDPGREDDVDVELRLHLRSLGTRCTTVMAPHPHARFPIISAKIIAPFDLSLPVIQGHIVAIILHNTKSCVLIWDWKSGQNLVVCLPSSVCTSSIVLTKSLDSQQCFTPDSSEPHLYPAYLSLISDQSFILTDVISERGNGGSLQIFSFDRGSSSGTDAPGSASTAPLDITATHRPPTHTATLQLPPLRAGAARGPIVLHATPHVAQHAHGRHVLLRDKRGGRRCHHILAFDTKYSAHDLYEHEHHPHRPPRLTCDFELLEGGRIAAAPSYPASVVSAPTEIPLNDVFAAPVITRLPYHIVASVYAPLELDLMLDDDRLVGVQGRNGPNAGDVEILTPDASGRSSQTTTTQESASVIASTLSLSFTFRAHDQCALSLRARPQTFIFHRLTPLVMSSYIRALHAMAHDTNIAQSGRKSAPNEDFPTGEPLYIGMHGTGASRRESTEAGVYGCKEQTRMRTTDGDGHNAFGRRSTPLAPGESRIGRNHIRRHAA
ncbi:hypothetical protein EVG20_g1796 [Dentipellis fragilis]|uniref:F-box domain-containing protein n=1 Tax=Dentipellis fragilis TaxID=205917 RepID=A0A4Y9Z9R6_9AGAM|nr:hypothetical protein EVG20_g1796 [Dentipellis fragilis]